MPKLHSAAASHADTASALALIDRQLEGRVGDAHLVFAFYGCGHDDALLHRHLRRRFGSAALMGGSSSGGLLTDRGVFDAHGIGLLVIDDAGGNYGAAAGPLGDDPAASAEALLRQALASCDCAGQLPELVWVYQAPGHEEDVVAGLRRLVGDGCPIVGGSAGDDDVRGLWRELGPDGPLGDGLVVGVLFPSQPLGSSFQGGYEPAGPRGVITACNGREVISIDGEPAAQVYNRWQGGRFDPWMQSGNDNIIPDTALSPLGVLAGRLNGVAHYQFVQPDAIRPGGVLSTLCRLPVGTQVFAMRGDRERLIERASRAVRQSHKMLDGHAAAGGLVMYCAGCKMAVGEDIGRVATGLGEVFAGQPFLCGFTLGEQGYLFDRNVHGNMMIAAVSFAG